MPMPNTKTIIHNTIMPLRNGLHACTASDSRIRVLWEYKNVIRNTLIEGICYALVGICLEYNALQIV